MVQFHRPTHPIGIHRTSESLARPAGRAFFQKRRDPLLRIHRKRVHAHDLLSICIGFQLVEIDLNIVRLLAERDGQGTCSCNPLG
jgi:hypothetical protein